MGRTPRHLGKLPADLGLCGRLAVQEHLADRAARQPGHQQHPATALLPGQAVAEPVALSEDRHQHRQVIGGPWADLHLCGHERQPRDPSAPVHRFRARLPGAADGPSGGLATPPPAPYRADMAARPAPAAPIPKRIVVIGGAGSGKTTLARALSVRLGARHLERDALGDDEALGFASQVAAAIDAAGSRWVFDGAPPPPSWSSIRTPTPWSPGLSPVGRAAARRGPVGPALAEPPRRWSPHLVGSSVALVGARSPGRLGREDACW